MATYHADPVWVVQLLMAGLCVLYVLSVWIVVHAAIASARAWTVELPLRKDEYGRPVDLILLDYSPRMWVSGGAARRSLKLLVLAAGGALGSAIWAAVLYFTYLGNDPVFGWTLQSETVVGGFHTVALFALIILGVWWGVRTAHRYQLEDPFVRLETFVAKFRQDNGGDLAPRASWYELATTDTPTLVYELPLPEGGSVVSVGVEDEKVIWYELIVPGNGQVRFGPSVQLSKPIKIAVSQFLVNCGL